MGARRVYRPTRSVGTRRSGRDPGGKFLTAEKRGRNVLVVVALVTVVIVVVTTWLLSRRADDPTLQQVDVPTSSSPGDQGMGGPSSGADPVVTTSTGSDQAPGSQKTEVDPSGSGSGEQGSDQVASGSGEEGSDQVASGELASARTETAGSSSTPPKAPSTTVPPETVPPETVPPETAPPDTVPPETAPPETAPVGGIGEGDPVVPPSGSSTAGGGLSAAALAGPDFYRMFRADGHSLVRAPTAEDPLRIWVGGDSLSGAVADELERYAATDPMLTVTKETRTSTGVVSEWFFDWRARMTQVASGGYDVIVLTMGGNDAQQFRGIPARVASEEWQAEYRRRVTTMLRTAARPGRLVIWIGMAPATPENIAPLMPVVDELTSAAVADTPGAAYVDAWAMFAGPEGQFVRSIVTPEGRRVRVRADDGVHYTLAAGRMLRDRVLQLVVDNVDSGSYRATVLPPAEG